MQIRWVEDTFLDRTVITHLEYIYNIILRTDLIFLTLLQLTSFDSNSIVLLNINFEYFNPIRLFNMSYEMNVCNDYTILIKIGDYHF